MPGHDHCDTALDPTVNIDSEMAASDEPDLSMHRLSANGSAVTVTRIRQQYPAATAAH
jgi:hypothetical protein